MAKKILKDELLETFQVDEATKRGLLVLYKAMAIPCIVVAMIIFLDFLLPMGTTDRGTVIAKKRQQMETTNLLIEIQGDKYHYLERVGKRAFFSLEKGDRVVLTLSPILKRVRKIEVVKEGENRSFGGRDFIPMLILAFLGLSTFLPYLMGTRFFSRTYFILVVATPLLALASIILLGKLVLISLGLMARL